MIIFIGPNKMKYERPGEKASSIDRLEITFKCHWKVHSASFFIRPPISFSLVVSQRLMYIYINVLLARLKLCPHGSSNLFLFLKYMSPVSENPQIWNIAIIIIIFIDYCMKIVCHKIIMIIVFLEYRHWQQLRSGIRRPSTNEYTHTLEPFRSVTFH